VYRNAALLASHAIYEKCPKYKGIRRRRCLKCKRVMYGEGDGIVSYHFLTEHPLKKKKKVCPPGEYKYCI
jgi:hypothetical protein